MIKNNRRMVVVAPNYHKDLSKSEGSEGQKLSSSAVQTPRRRRRPSGAFIESAIKAARSQDPSAIIEITADGGIRILPGDDLDYFV